VSIVRFADQKHGSSRDSVQFGSVSVSFISSLNAKEKGQRRSPSLDDSLHLTTSLVLLALRLKTQTAAPGNSTWQI
jgi:hypothetical protein